MATVSPTDRTGTPAPMPPVFCARCVFASACTACGCGEEALSGLRHIVERVGPFRDGDYLFRPGTPYRAAYAVQTGMAKTVALDAGGRERVLGFHLPGELFGLDALHGGEHANAAIALGTSWFCRFPHAATSRLASAEPAVQRHLLRTMSLQINQARAPSFEYGADERMAAFLVDLRDRRAALGLRSESLPLAMSRVDIASYLQLAAETVSRSLARFKAQGLITVNQRQIGFIDLPGLRRLARPLWEG
jgi:CRP/FNR family transcriptional regulator